MQAYIKRSFEKLLRESLLFNPVTALVGPRQCGKSTLARQVVSGRKDVLVLDLELPSDLNRLSEPELFLGEHSDKLICIDEIQYKPEIFPVLRSLVDMDRRPGRFLILGSASRDLIRHGGESLAGRIHYLELAPFHWQEIGMSDNGLEIDFMKLWWRGGFPPALLEQDEQQSLRWRRDLIQDYLSRDIPQLGFAIPAPKMLRFWRMMAHYHGQVLNASKLGQALDVSHNTVRKYLDILDHTFMVRVLQPWSFNQKKRLVKSPKIYVRDSGLLHALMELDTMDNLYGHPVFGASWEGWCVEQITGCLPEWQQYFYRTSSGEEIDLILLRGRRRLAFEIKASKSPHLSRGFPGAIDLLKPERCWVVCPMSEQGYALRPNVSVVGISECISDLKNYIS